jgi:Carboxypeptidase regulatory-like domain
LLSPGFQSLTVKSIQIVEGELKSVPDLRLKIGDCGGHAVRDYIRFLPWGVRVGNLGGSVRLDQGPLVGKSPPIAGADVTLICGLGTACGATKTDSNGDFIFKNLPPGSLSVRVNLEGFYPINEHDYTVEEGLESIYCRSTSSPVPWEIAIQPCTPRSRLFTVSKG